jgi:hypothetical protein
MLAAISTDETKSWFEGEVRRMLNDAHELDKSFNRNRMRDVRVLESMKLIGDGENRKKTDEDK